MTAKDEDEKMYKCVLSLIHGTYVIDTQETKDALLSWFKSLYPHLHWKPSKEQLDAAAIAYSKRVTGGRMYRDLLAGFIAGAEWMAEQIKEDKQ